VRGHAATLSAKRADPLLGFRLRHAALLAVGLVSATLSCSKNLPLAEPAAPLTPPSRLCTMGEAPPVCRSALEIERLLSNPTQILGIADTPSGAQGAKILTLASDQSGKRVVFRAKWRPQSSGGLINEPRKELAGYAVQKLFLHESELVAPPTVAHCFPLAEYRRFAATEPASFDAIDCVFGFASYWLEDVKTVGSARKDGLLGEGEGIWDAQLFKRDAVYRGSVGKSNLLTYLINHGDAHEEQFLLESTPRGLRAYVVDNSISLRSIKNPMLLFREDWSQIQVPFLPKEMVGRLRALTPETFAGLGAIAVFERRGNALVDVSALGAMPKSDGTAMSWHGNRLRIGLTSGEIDLVASRVKDFLARPDLERMTER
jgi:hypothetical protein